MSMAHGQAGGLQVLPFRAKAGCVNSRLPTYRIHRQRQRLIPQALAFGGLAPAGHNLQTELEALENSQGAAQQVFLIELIYRNRVPRDPPRAASICVSE